MLPSTLISFGILFSTKSQLISFGSVACSLDNPRVVLFNEKKSGFVSLETCTLAYSKDPTFISNQDVLFTTTATPMKNQVTIQLPPSSLSYTSWMTHLSPTDFLSWHSPKLTLSIITNTRPDSLSRLLASLKSAHYFGDQISLRINLDQAADTLTRSIVSSFTSSWDHGPVFAHHRIIQAGLLPAVLESWYPASDDEYALLLEDDVELSPLFYAWIKLTLLSYGPKYHPSLFGISLYQPKNTELHPDGRKPFDPLTVLPLNHPQNAPYLSQVPCSWGAVYFPRHWREFHDYIVLRLSELAQNSPIPSSTTIGLAPNPEHRPYLPLNTPIVPNIRSNKWSKSWKKYFIELAYLRGYVMLYPNFPDYLRGYVMLYPNFPDYLSFSTNHHEVGVHVRAVMTNTSDASDKSSLDARKEEFMVPLFKAEDSIHMGYLSPSPSPPHSNLISSPYSNFYLKRNTRSKADSSTISHGGLTLPPYETLPVLNLTGDLVIVPDPSSMSNSGLDYVSGSGYGGSSKALARPWMPTTSTLTSTSALREIKRIGRTRRWEVVQGWCLHPSSPSSTLSSSLEPNLGGDHEEGLEYGDEEGDWRYPSWSYSWRWGDANTKRSIKSGMKTMMWEEGNQFDAYELFCVV
ncbi:hypothetical protein VKT23_009250 [Stygiomarasmius scandens]|uniref:Uncharacterized protein n=1 Tax=Marasmiellus scandens TaxID=2682957 RepID=A0ABR1JKW3_9AGAR